MNGKITISEEIDAFENEWRVLLNECQNFCFATRAKEFQAQAREKLKELEAKAQTLKKKAVSYEVEDSANKLLSFQEIINAISNELSMWIALKDDDAGLAWDCLVNAQMAVKTAMQAHSVASHLDNYSSHLSILEHHLFPKQMFASPGMIIKEARCSICKQEYGECDHLVGKPYMGEICVREIVHVDLKEFSLVEKPANKHARVTSFTDEEGVHRDFLTWRPAIKATPNTKGNKKDSKKPLIM
ncbi:hypothetical protein KDW_06870 [Dictyobacter vulcani]|uniref:Uncharacterized protein n=1 Tax=Dictyobacter vulcani TaxID=2607529 RepID=A0A5J4KGD8_9CHLR|nr:hypothetical protein [Dictyobacter vulcani]GER86525.1 hypothetical protein KDW_06870 [Dictyobacter vulcani]